MNTNSTPEVASQSKPKRRVGRFLLRSLLVLIILVLVAHFAWKYSGSNQWEKVGEQNGVVVYSLKAPGSTIEKFKAVWTIHSTLNRAVAWVNDNKGDGKHHPMGLYDLRFLERRGSRLSVSAYKQPIASFLRPREFVIQNEFSQDPKTKVLIYTVNAVPDRIPPDDCCVRVRAMANRWTLTPRKGGVIEVEWFADMDLGGFLPYALQNKVMPGGMLTFAQKVEGYMAREKYKDVRYDWVQELEP